MSGRHRKPCPHHMGAATAATAVLVSTSGGFAAVPAWADPVETGPPGGWDPVIHCESGGNPHSTNGASTASGLFQFLDSTWRGLGGTVFGRRAMDATPEEQLEMADKAYSQSGLTPWEASRHCWAGRIGQRQNVTQRPVQLAPSVPLPRPQARPGSADQRSYTPGRSYTVRDGDRLIAIAARFATTWQKIQAANPAIKNPNLIYVGQVLALPA